MHQLTSDLTEVIDQLQRQRDRHDRDRYPVQYATLSFHLGSALLQATRPDAAIGAFRDATRLFPAEGMPVEHAKAHLMLGIALRDVGQFADAQAAFALAAQMFGAHDQPLERAAALHNQGLVLRDLGDVPAAAEAFTQALTSFRDADARDRAAASARELGSALLELGHHDQAEQALRDAIDHARRAADRQGLGAALNALGILYLHTDRLSDARAAFEDATGANPRGIRPGPYAMARANLALACERTGAIPLARLAARQALSVAVADAAVHDQARQVLERVGDDAGALARVLDDEPEGRWTHVIREEAHRLLALDRTDREQEVRAWVQSMGDHPAATERWVAWLGVLLEVAPDDMRELATACVTAVAALPDPRAASVRSVVGRAMIQFEVPQFMRLRDTFSRLSAELGHAADWG
jgi:tetratricopeptide (TPR) repeat protein